ncbi:Methoxyneurosporene dehydrogenase [Minicystis rosea]|nr:Methoxyneurosporene dehydrogenase [Minicystis rosea]
MAQRSGRAVVVGAGVGGLVTAALLARRGLEVTVLERADRVGGKMRQVVAGGRAIDAGPTVLTMRWVFEEIFAALGERVDDHLTLERAERLARHVWREGDALDLFTDPARSADAIGAFAGAAEARGYLRFVDHVQRIHDTVERPFLRSERPSLRTAWSAARELGLGALLAIDGHRTMWKALGEFFADARLRQLFGRYATYSGSSPFLAPATLNVIAHVERDGVWLVEGGMYRIAEALRALAERAGAVIRTRAHVAEILADGRGVTGVRLADGERVEAEAVIMNGDAEALARGLLGHAVARAASAPPTRSLSAMTWTGTALTSGFSLVRHNVFFSSDYEAEFRDLFDRSRVPREPTIYVCAQDRDDAGAFAGGPERLLILINAPPSGDRPDRSEPQNEVHACERRTFDRLSRLGLRLESSASPMVVTTPSDFHRLFPATGGALYGPASHGMTSAFHHGTSRTKVPGLYLCGGSAHPGAGVPMVAQSGRLAAASVIEDLASTSRSRRAAMPGGISMS